MFDNAMQIYKEMIRDAHGGSAGKSPHLETRRRQFEAMADVFKTASPEQLAGVDSFIAAPGREISIPICPPDGDGPMSTLVYMHGGGYRPESPYCHDTVIANLASAAGVQVFAVHYRRSPENPCPAAIDDGYGVLQWAEKGTGGCSIDRDRLGVARDSADGVMMAAPGKMARDSQGSRLCAPGLDLSRPDESNTDAHSYLCSQEDSGFNGEITEFCLTSYARRLERHDPDAIPPQKTNYRNLPSAIIHIAELDPLFTAV